ncbi:hypothetical protein COJ70_24290 [Priestia megaterium]|uniref:AAA domain-containing protein n=1 Tax=Priestia megaterium TaxID=1404 RepID=UPI000BF3BA7F|nr:AAA domain-containing protein [Priestia megaterium]PFO12692.1 hypothetical protein COJ70_24290 [Priestia megaterium]
MSIEGILDYYCEYEANERFMQSSLKKTQGSDNNKSVLNNTKKIETILLEKKSKVIYSYIKPKLSKGYIQVNDEVKDNLNILIQQSLRDMNKEILQENIVINNKKIKLEFIDLLDNMINQEEIIICYPIIENKEKKHPILTFHAKIERNILIINDFFVNKNSLLIILAEATNSHILEVGDLYEAQIKQLLEMIDNIEGQTNLHEIISLVDNMIAQIFKGKDAYISAFNNYQGWYKVDKTFITIETLQEIMVPEFRREIKFVKEKIKNAHSPVILNKYLDKNKDQINYSSIENQFNFHYGSYTEDYPINRKQWDVVGNVENVHLLSVNGPPGTGKTTLLKEIIANQLVTKAKRLISAWDKNWDLINKGTKREVFQSPFGGDNLNSIIITSTNNKAVDNIGQELLKEIPYFNKYLPDNLKKDMNFQGLLCARLGKKENLDFFKDHMLRVLIDGLNNETKEEAKEDFLVKFKKTYEELGQIEEHIKQFQNNQKALLKISKGANLKFLEIVKLEGDYKNLLVNLEREAEEFQQQKLTVEQEKETLDNQKAIIYKNIQSLNETKSKKEEEHKRLYIDYNQFDQLSRSNFLGFKSKKRKDFSRKYPTKHYIEEKLDFVKEELSTLNEKIFEYKEKRISLSLQYKRKDEHLLSIVDNLQHIQNEKKLLIEYRKIFQNFILNKKELEQTLENKIEDNCSLYKLVNSSKVLKLRKKLFDLSLVVHEEYVRKHKECIAKNLEKVVEGRGDNNGWFSSFYNPQQQFNDNFADGIKALWETLFICFPIATTTLHSFNVKNFQMIESLFDNLLVDEAGQILPHYLIGPLYRSRRAIIVGDVYQLEPIRLQNDKLIKNYQQFDDEMQKTLCIEENSVQSYSDYRSDIFEKLGEEKLGIILEEHRRCEDSIVEFSNKYVYKGKLDVVNSDNHNKLFGRNLVAFDIRGIQKKDNINELEITTCQKIVEYYILKYGEDYKKNIAIITPYKNQSEKLKEKVKGIDIGTVHTFQGQEKKVVIISTVVDNTQKVKFVGGTANLLNVAFTRGKEQIIFVGNVEVALRSKNYLQHAVETIRERGFIYSLYDNQLNINQEGIQVHEAVKIFTANPNNIISPLGIYIKNYFEEGIIRGAKEHYEFLIQSLNTAKKSITIVSPWITNYVIDEKFINLIQETLKRGVKVRIIFGYNKTNYTLKEIDKIVKSDYPGHKNPDKVEESIQKIRILLASQLIYKPPMHTKLVLIDDEVLVIGSHNWLSNRGSSENAKEEISCIISNPNYIKYIKEAYNNEVITV